MVVGNYRGPTHLGKGVDRSVQRHCPDHVRRTGFLAVGRVGPDNFAKLDEVDRAATGQERVTVGEGLARPDEHSCSEGCIHLVAAPGDEIGLLGEVTVRRELGAVDSYGDLPVMGGVDDLVDRRQPSGDVRSAGDGEQARLGGPVQFIRDIAGCEGPVGSALDIAARGYTRPRQEIGVVFDDGGDDNVVGTQAQGGRRGG